jgi:hypothetical protein
MHNLFVLLRKQRLCKSRESWANRIPFFWGAGCTHPLCVNWASCVDVRKRIAVLRQHCPRKGDQFNSPRCGKLQYVVGVATPIVRKVRNAHWEAKNIDGRVQNIRLPVLGITFPSIHVWRYCPFWALTSLNRHLLSSVPLARLFQSRIPAICTSVWTTSSYLSLAFHTGLVPCGFTLSRFLWPFFSFHFYDVTHHS